MIPSSKARETGLPWIPLLPEHWQLKRLKHLVAERSEKGYPDEPLLTASQSHGVIEKKDYGTRTVEAQKDLHLLKLVEPGDYVISLRSFQGGIEYAHKRGIISPAYTILKPGPDVRRGFFEHYFKSAPFVGAMSLFVTGIREGQNIDYVRLSRAYMPVPPLEEQEQIGRFVRHLDSKVTQLIKAKRRLIELLTEQKQAIIHRTVTRGLDPTVRLKPSGVDWLGDLPAHWRVMHLRRLIQYGRKITYGIVQPGELDMSGRYMVRGQDYSFGWAKPEAIFRVSESVEVPYRRSRLQTGDVLVTIVGAGVGNVAVVPEWLDGANITQTTARVAISPTLADPDFVVHVLQSPVGRRNVDTYVKGAAQPGLNLEHLKLFLIPLPPLEEQVAISSDIKRQTSGLDAAKGKALTEIELIREYRTRLIADVVTGQLDVRHLNLPEIEGALIESIESTDLESDVDETDDILEEAEV